MAEEEKQEVAEQIETVFNGSMPEGENETTCLEVSAKATINADQGIYKQAVGYYPFGKDLQDAVSRFGEEVVFTNYRAQAKIKLQSLMRSFIIAGKDVANLLATWKPGIQMERTPVAPEVAAENAFDRMDEAGKQAFLEKLMAKMNG